MVDASKKSTHAFLLFVLVVIRVIRVIRGYRTGIDLCSFR